MARANGRGQSSTRILSTVLFGLATMQLPGVFGTPTPVVFGVRVGMARSLYGLFWLVGLAVAALAPGLQRVLQAAGLHAGRVRRSDIFADPVVQDTAAASVVSHVDLRTRGCGPAPGGLPDRAGTLLVTVVTLEAL